MQDRSNIVPIGGEIFASQMAPVQSSPFIQSQQMHMAFGASQ